MDRMGRTRREINFLKEAGVDEIDNFPADKPAYQPYLKKERIQIKKDHKKIKMSGQTNQDLERFNNGDGRQLVEGDLQDVQMECQPKQINLHEVLNKLQMIKISQQNKIQGCLGHTTLYFTRPIIQGKYYLEIQIQKHEDSVMRPRTKYPPSLRIGVCPMGYSKTISLGQEISIAYKSMSGEFITNSKSYQAGQVLLEGDTVGICYNFSPPDKHQSVDKIWEGSELIILKNGQEVGKWNKIPQSFFCPAISLYNFLKIQLNLKTDQIKFMPLQYKPYLQIYKEEIGYEDLKSKKIFSDFIRT